MKNKGMDAGPLNESVSFQIPEQAESHRMPWVTNGATFPHGTEFRGRYKGYTYFAKVDNGAMVLNGKAFLSPSAAAVTITRNPVDGWVFWDCKVPEKPSWVNLRDVRK